MKRRIIQRVVVILLLCAIVNVAVAWGCASFGGTWTEWQLGPHDWPIAVPSTWPTQPTFGWENPGLLVHVTQSRAYLPEDTMVGNPVLHGIVNFRVGWPMRALHWSLWGAKATGTLDYWPYQPINHWASGLPPLHVADDVWKFQRRMPVAPIWPGFAINTIFYAAVLLGGWMVFAFPFVWRRRRRIKRGLCPACAYPVGGSPVCTECGKPVTPKSVEPS